MKYEICFSYIAYEDPYTGEQDAYTEYFHTDDEEVLKKKISEIQNQYSGIYSMYLTTTERII